MKLTRSNHLVHALALLALLAGNIVAAPLGTAFTYSGQLQQTGSPANAVCDFQFSLWDAATAGAQVGATLTNNAVGVSNGLFTVTLDFGAAAFTGDARWLQVAVQTNGASAFSPLSPRQSVPTTPFALYAVMAGKVAATNLIGQVLDSQLSTNVALLNTNANFRGAVTATNFSGNGNGLTNLNASQLASGTVPGPRLGGTYGNAVAFTNSGNSISGNGAGLTSLDPANLSAGTAAINISGNASTATTAVNLNGNGHISCGGLSVRDSNGNRAVSINPTGSGGNLDANGDMSISVSDDMSINVDNGFSVGAPGGVGFFVNGSGPNLGIEEGYITLDAVGGSGPPHDFGITLTGLFISQS